MLFKRYTKLFSFSLFLCAVSLFAANAAAQTSDALAAQIGSASEEQKREALLRIRNLRSAEASRLAVPALRDSSEIVRATAAFSVVFLPPEEAFDALSPNLNDKSELVRRETAYALGRIRNASALPLLIRTFQKDKIPEVRNAAIVALGELGERAAVPVLTQILEARPAEANEFLRRSAARSIGQIAQFLQTGETEISAPEISLPDKSDSHLPPKYRNLAEASPEFRQATAVLTALLKNANEADDTRREAAFALGAIADPAAAPILEASASAKDYYLAEISRAALRKIKSAAGEK